MPNKKYSFERPPAAPIFKPTLKEFEDPLTYIEKIRPIAQKYGICKIISPKQWNPPFAVNRSTFKFRPRVQNLNEVGAQARIRNNFIRSLEAYWEHQSTPLVVPIFRGVRVDLFLLHNKVRHYGGSHQVTKNKQWTMVCRELGMAEKAKMVSSQVKGAYEKLIQPYLDFCDNKFLENNKEQFPDDVSPSRIRGKTAMTIASPKMTRSKTNKFKKQIPLSCTICESVDGDDSMVLCVECDLKCHIKCLTPPLSDVISPWMCSRCLEINCARELSRLNTEVFGFTQSTCKYTLESFAAYADTFKKTYFKDRQNVSLKDVEEEYWRLVAAEDGNEDVTVKYGADISSGKTGSGFPTKANRDSFSENDQKYIDSGWNLNNLPVLNKSIFRFVSNDISGMTVPWCYVGMVFSCFCWHIEDHWSYSINYMHTGECKTWYGVPESDADLFEALMQKEAGQLFEKSPDLLHHITTQINPAVLIKNNVKVYRTDQAPGEFVVTFPRAYHAGFNQGFNFAEAVNFCPADWLSKGRASVESYRIVKRPSVFSHNELICKMATSIDSLDIVLLKAVYEEIVIIQQEEKVLRKQICTLAQGTCRTERLQLDQISEDDRECVYCRTTLYMSGVTCSLCCTNDRMMCLDHVKSVCQCTSMENMVLKYRYSLDEISTLVATVKNKLEQYNLWMTRIYHLAKSEFCASPVSVEEGRVMRNVSQFVENLGVLNEDDFSVKCVEEKPNLEELKMLLQLGQKMNCPELLLDFLEAIIDTCQRAMNMTDQLLKSHRISVDKQDNQQKNELNIEETRVTSVRDDQKDKLTLGEMRILVEKLRSLPAHVPQLEEAAQTLYTINEWRKKVKTVAGTNAICDDNVLAELIASGESNLVYLSEYQMLQKMRVYAKWMTSARGMIGGINRAALPSLEECRTLREEGLELVGTLEVDRIATVSEILELDEEDEPCNGNVNDDDGMSDYRVVGWSLISSNLNEMWRQLTKIIDNADAMQHDVDNILNSTSSNVTLNGLKTLIKTVDSNLNCVVFGIERLKEIQKEAMLINTKITDMWQKLQLCRRLIHIDDLQALIKQADSVRIAFDHLADLKSLSNTIDAWKKNLHQLFVKASLNSYITTPSLLEILFPRPARMFKLMIARETVSSKLVIACKAESTIKKDETSKDYSNMLEEKINVKKGKGRQKRASFSSDDPQIARKDNVNVFEQSKVSGTSLDMDTVNISYGDMCIDELKWMWKLRELNEDKASKDSSGHDFYCFCRKRGIDQKGAQVMCDLCQDWFHLACLGIQNKDMSKKKFLCPQCERSKRPAFELLLAEKRKLDREGKMLQIPEHIVLSLMLQRVISFHKHIYQLFSVHTELAAVFADYKKFFGEDAQLPTSTDALFLDTSSNRATTEKHSRKTPHVNIYPATTPATIPASNKQTQMNIHRLKVSLSDSARRQLEEIYIELCLLEVNQPSVTWIWNLYHNLIDCAEDDENCDDKYNVKKEKSSEHFSDLSDTTDNGQSGQESGNNKSMAKSVRKPRQPIKKARRQKSVKHECLSSSDEKQECDEKFAVKRKMPAKKSVRAKAEVKKEPMVKSPTNVVIRKRSRVSKKPFGYNDMWEEEKFGFSSEYYDEEDDVIILDKVDVKREPVKAKRVKKPVGAMKCVSEDKQSNGTRVRQRKNDEERHDYVSHVHSQSLSKPTKMCPRPLGHDEVTLSAPAKRRRRANVTRRKRRVCNDDCEADECVQQSSDNVNWIACDSCNLWYHWLCIGINSDDEIGDCFLCCRCKMVAGVHTDWIPSLNNKNEIGSNEQQPVSLLGIVHEHQHQQQQQYHHQPDPTYYHTLSPPPPFLQPECCVQEEIVDMNCMLSLA